MGRFEDVADTLEAKLLAIVDPTNANNAGKPYIGKILIGNPYIDNWAEYLEKNTVITVNNNKAVRVWIINRTQNVEAWQTQTQSYVTETWILEGWFGYTTADLNSRIDSEPEFNDWLDTVFDKLREDQHITTEGGVQLFDTREAATTQPDYNRLLRYGKALCHHVEITFTGEVDYTF